jgi:tRNA nucleotidyltransferase/poly(A) polymerase
VKISRERVGKEIEKMLKGIPYCLLALSRSH